MSLFAGDLTTPARVQTWIPELTPASNTIIAQLISSMSSMIYSKLNRARLYSQPFSRVIEGVGNYQLMLPDWPVTAIAQVQNGAVNIPAAPLPVVSGSTVTTNGPGWGYRWVPWNGNLPGDPTMLEFLNGTFRSGVQNIKVQYTAGYLEANEPATVPAATGPYTVTVLQPQGIWCRDNGVTYAATGVALVPVKTLTGAGQYIIPPDTAPGLYTFDSADASASLLVSYSFVPADLEEACIQMVAERYSYRSRVGVDAKSLGGQETMHYLRGGRGMQMFPSLPPEVEGLIWPYVSTLPPPIGAPL